MCEGIWQWHHWLPQCNNPQTALPQEVNEFSWLFPWKSLLPPGGLDRGLRQLTLSEVMGQEAQKATDRQCPAEHFAAAMNYTWGSPSFSNSSLHSCIKKLKQRPRHRQSLLPFSGLFSISSKPTSAQHDSPLCLGLGATVFWVENSDTQ